MSNNLNFLLENDNFLITDGSSGTASSMAAELAESLGHGVAILGYPASGVDCSPDHAFEIDVSHLKEANRYLMRANKNMHRSWPRQQLAQDNALRRDLWMVRWAHAIYMVGLFTQDASLLKISTDAAWAAQMYVDRFIFDGEPMTLCELYLFDMKSESWWQWAGSWTKVSSVPTPTGIYTVIGSDKLTTAAKAAIKDLYTVSQ